MKSINIESLIDEQNAEGFALVQDAIGPDAEITSIDPLTTEIETLIDRTSSLHQHDYVVGEVADYGVSGKGNVHFKLVHRKEGRENKKDDRLHCAIFKNRRADITASIREGQRIAVAGDVSFYAPKSCCSIEVEEVVLDRDDSSHPFEMIRMDRRVQITIATVLLLWY